MKKLLSVKYYWPLIVALLVILSCEKDFDEINTDPNSFSDVPTHFFLAGSILSIANAENNYFDGYLYPSSWIQHTALLSWNQPGNYFYERGRSNLWNGLYRGPLVDLNKMISQAEEEDNTTLQAVGLTLHAYGFSLLVNAFGDIPYTESFRVDEAINQPIYNKQSDVYDAILDNLRQADKLLEGVRIIDVDPAYDILFGGEGLKWRKFANSLRFRLLVHLSGERNVSDELAGISPVFESPADNAIYQYPGNTQGATYPPAQAIGPEATDQGHRVAAPLIDKMKATNDPRLAVYANLNDAGEYEGVVPGTYFIEGDEFSSINAALFQRNATITFMNFSELRFLQAEAAEQGLIGGDVLSFLSEGISFNMTRLGVPTNEIDSYVSTVIANGTNLEEIYLEKWVSMFGRGMQAWTDYRRTGIPSLRPVPSGIVDLIPKRFTYPENEQTTNNANMNAAAVQLSKGDALDSDLIWTFK